ncbi:MAG: hypothetical protein LAO04_21965 [Acidobacteriia bacterium]|nr:hypothetical protein [Terriglobia bacterium]
MINSSWFTTAYDYSGPAEVVFEDPHAEFFGPASVGPDEYGRPVVEITVEHSIPAILEGFDLAAIQLGSKTLPDGVQIISLGGGAPNRARVTVKAKEGVFKSAPSWEYRFSDMSPDTPLTLRLTPMKSEYTVDALAREKFMVLPLSGFVSESPKLSTVLRGHPLCVPGGVDSDTTRCITFQVNGEMAFIQQLPSVDEGGVGIKPWSGETVLTAVAVVPIADPAMTDPWGWFLNVFLRLLDLASGSRVGTPWIEVRDENGRLARRLHFAINQVQRSVEGYGAIQEAIHWCNGEFLTTALSSAEAREPFFSIALRHCFRAGLPGLSIDDQLAHLIRALECLCKRYGFSKQDLTDGFAPGSKNAVEGVLSTAGADIQKIAGTMIDPGREQVLRIAERTRSAAQKEQDFGLALRKLTGHFGLLDLDVLEPYYATHPGPGGRNWVRLLSYYRGAVFHEGYLDLDSPATPVGEVLGFILHLHDLLVRILLKIIGYRGTYQPRSIRATAAETVDWFRPGVNVGALLRVPTMGIK